jgi:hypothetical protein
MKGKERGNEGRWKDKGIEKGKEGKKETINRESRKWPNILVAVKTKNCRMLSENYCIYPEKRKQFPGPGSLVMGMFGLIRRLC